MKSQKISVIIPYSSKKANQSTVIIITLLCELKSKIARLT
ncbi:hypothetical protein FORC066_0533 [Yersinia enterocolitica]|nr:hypothetical protein FORC066_0533 [Yersinia enterocolitica]